MMRHVSRRDWLTLAAASWAGAWAGSRAWAAAVPAEPAWVAAMRAVHARFTGKPGTLAHFGDSITNSMAYWAPLQWSPRNLDERGTKALAAVKGHMVKEGWAGRGPQFGNEGGKTVRWALENVDGWLHKLTPEVAVVMFGTNDLGPIKEDEYAAKLRQVVQKCLDNGTVAILSTIPPKHGQAEKAARFAEVARTIAADLKVPLIDYHAEILKRRPDDWDGAATHKGARDVYDVPTLISADGVHPSNPKKWANDYSEEGLKNSGYGLRTYLTLLAYGEVIERVLKGK